MKAFMYPGQGAQRVGMGAALFAQFPEHAAKADAVLGYSIAKLCGEGPQERLTETRYTQPALYTVCALEHLRRTGSGDAPDFVLGHSVGEYAALFAAGAVDFETGLRLVQKRGALMHEAKDGGMAAVIGLELAQIEDVLWRKNLSGIYPANINTPRQIVLSGKRQAIADAEKFFTDAGATHYVILQVGGAFHTPFMAEAGKAFADFLKNIPFNEPKIPVISNVTGRPHEDDIRARMAEQITAPVKWCESIRYLLAQGLRFDDFHEIGAGGAPVLKPMIKRIESEAGPLDATAPAASINQATRKAAYPRTALPGSRAFCETFGVQHPCLAGAMYQGIASVPLVTRMARAGMLAFFGAGGLGMREVEDSIIAIRAATAEHAPFGVNFISHLNRPQLEDELTDILLKFNVRCIEASAFMEVSPALVRYRAHGLRSEGEKIRADNRVIAKLSHPDVAARFLASAPEAIIIALLEKRAISSDQAELLRHVPMCDAVCVESDSGGHTDQGMPFVLIPAMLRLRDAQAERFPRFANIHVGAGGGIGTPEAAAAVFMLGAEFIVTGSVNQCTVEARTSDAVKDMLETMSVRDTAYAPSPEMFELGSKVQVFKKGLFFPARAEKLLGLYRQHDSLDAIDSATRAQIEERFFRASFESVYDELRTRYSPSEIGKAETMPKHKMALVFRRYFRDSTRWALDGVADRKVDFQIHCGPALGAFNQWMAGSAMQSWRNRHADEIALHLLEETAGLLSRRFALLTGNAA